MTFNFNASPVDLYDMPMKVIENDCSPVRYAIVKHREGERPPVTLMPEDVIYP